MLRLGVDNNKTANLISEPEFTSQDLADETLARGRRVGDDRSDAVGAVPVTRLARDAGMVDHLAERAKLTPMSERNLFFQTRAR